MAHFQLFEYESILGIVNSNIPVVNLFDAT